MQNLPLEAILRIFSFLDGGQVAKCTEVGHKFLSKLDLH
jgi:hypothetical protein